MADTKDKRYMSDNAQLMAEWDWEKNSKLDPTTLTIGSGKKVWWKHWHESTETWHEWEATIANRAMNHSKCPYCCLGRRKVLSGFNDLLTWCNLNNCDHIVDEWDYEKNAFSPSECLPASHKKVWWKCQLGHSWDMTIAHRTSMKCGCPICENLRVEVGYNDLATWCNKNGFETLLAEWDYDKNQFTPYEVVPQSHKKAYWKCKLGHTWKAIIKDRTIKGYGCPECSKRRRTSFPEQAILFYIQKSFNDAVNGDRIILEGLELDIYVPSINFGIEYDGMAYHNDSYRDRRKCLKCQEKGITLYRIREYGCNSETDEMCAEVFYITPGNICELNAVIKTLLLKLSSIYQKNVFTDVDILRDQITIQNSYIFDVIQDSFAKNHPQLALEWDYEKNGSITPDKVAKSSTQKYYWICPKGHDSYLSSLANRHMGSGCPICANRQALKGDNDLGTWCLTHNLEYLLEEWDTEKNEAPPTSFLPKSNIRVWWKCISCGHSWQTKIEDRTSRARGCPQCAIKKRASKNSKKVRNDDTGEVFDNAREAQKKYPGSITACCLGRTQTAAGYHWSYVDE